MFFLKAARSLVDPELRHLNVAIGYATSGDLIHWTEEDGVKQRIGLASSADLYRWRRHPASPVLECDARWYSGSARAGTRGGGIWCVPADSVLGPFNTSRAVPLAGAELYSG